jgi:Holliday junction resolvasome RuvABC endonuclease subunit
MNILAIDQSTACTGFAIFHNQNLKESGIFKPTGELFERIHQIKEYIRELIQDNSIDYVLIEDIQYQRNQKTYKILACLQGVIIDLLIELNMQFEIVPPSRWKAWNQIGGKRREQQKENTKRKCQEIYGREFHEDEADAACIGLFGLKWLERNEDAI